MVIAVNLLASPKRSRRPPPRRGLAPARRRVAEMEQACGFADGGPLPFDPARS
jgi:hypothetical protein